MPDDRAMLAILAAGQSRRFGDQDKLMAVLNGKMLGLHIAENLAVLDCPKCVVAPEGHACADEWTTLGYALIANNEGANGQAVSVSLAAAAAKEARSCALIICLADMPFVTAALIEQLIASFDGTGRLRPAACKAGDMPMPPAIFPDNMFDQLISLSGDQGARTLLRDAQCVSVNERFLMDIDTAGDLEQANEDFV